MKYLYTFYAWLIGGLFFLIITLISIPVLSVVPAKKYYPVFKFFMRTLFALLLVRIKRIFLEPIDSNQRIIYIPNHVSLLDAPLCAAYVPEFITALEAAEHFKWPLYGTLTKLYGNIPIERKSYQHSMKSFQTALKTLTEKNSMVIFPEGSRTEDGSIGRFKKMPFQLAKDAKVAIVPLGMSGVFTLFPKHSMLLSPSQLKFKFGKIIPVEQVVSMEINELIEYTYQKVCELKEYD